MTIRQQIKQARTSRGWSQEALAKRVKKNKSTICNWERRGPGPTLDDIKQLQRVFDTTFTI